MCVCVWCVMLYSLFVILEKLCNSNNNNNQLTIHQNHIRKESVALEARLHRNPRWKMFTMCVIQIWRVTLCNKNTAHIVKSLKS